MDQASIESVCECQVRLEANLDEHRHVLNAWAVDANGNVERAPAHTIGGDQPRFDVAWACPFCGRNTLRSFAAEALLYKRVTSRVVSSARAKAG